MMDSRKMVDFVPTEKGTTIRMPSTANLMVDSADRQALVNPPYFAADVSIQRNVSLLNGFFTRIATTEVVLDWKQPNVANGLLVQNGTSFPATFTWTDGGNPPVPLTIPDGFYTPAEMIDTVARLVNALGGTQLTVTPALGVGAIFTPNGVNVVSLSGVITTLLFNIPVVNTTAPAPFQPTFNRINMRPYRYIDFVSAQLTYPQDVKDASTAVNVRDVLCRWYFAWDNWSGLDQYGYYIEMGTTPFSLRRTFNPPKQIRWDTNLPVGNLSFQLYLPNGNQLTLSNADTNWLMTLQISEV